MKNSSSPLTSLLAKIVDNRGKSVPTVDAGFPLIATNCIKHGSIYPVFENIRYIDFKTKENWFRDHPEANDIIFVNKGTPGRVCLVPEPVSFCIAQDMVAFRCDKTKIDYQYLFAALRSDLIQKKVRNFHVGLAIPHFKKGDLDNLLIPRMATRAKELAIGQFYLTLSKRIECNNLINAELEAIARTLYDYWFVQFDFPDANGRPYKTSGGKMGWNEALKREIPEGWDSGVLSDIANITMGQSPPGDSYNEEGRGVVFFQGSTDFGERSPDVRMYTTAPGRMAGDGDILVSVRAPVGTLNIADRDCCIGRGVAALNSKRGFDGYLYQVMVDFKQIFDRRSSEGTTFGSITKDDLRGLKVLIPDARILHAHARIANDWSRLAALRDRENRDLTHLRDWLLPLLMNGQVRVTG